MSRRDDELKNIPSMKIDQDEVRARRPSSKDTVSSSVLAKGKAATSNNAKVKVDQAKALVWPSVVLGLFVIALGGFAYYQSEQITELEDTLRSTDADIIAQGQNLDEFKGESEKQHKFANSEIRKLWGVAYDKNRKSISANATAIARIENKVKSNTSKVANTSKSLGKSSSAIDRLNAQLRDKDTLVTEANQRAMLLGDVIEEQQGQMQKMADRIAGLEQKNRVIKVELEKKIKANEDIIAGFDTYRKSVSRQLNELRKQMNASAPPIN